jgi:hypothetical protein
MEVEMVEIAPPLPREVAVLVPVRHPDVDADAALLDLLPESHLFTVRQAQQTPTGDTTITVGRIGGPEVSAVTALGPEEVSPGRIVVTPKDIDQLRERSYYVGGVIRWDPVPGTERMWEVEVPLLRLHRPQVPGCEAEYALGRGTSSGGSFKFTLGVGVGGEATIKATESDTYKVDANCIEVVALAQLVGAEISMRVNGDEVRRYWDSRIVEVNVDELDPRALAPAQDGCHEPLELAELLPEFNSRDLRQTGDPPELTMKVGLERVSKATIGLELDLGKAAPVTVELGLERETEETTEITTTLVAGRLYAVYVPASGSTLERCWSTT